MGVDERDLTEALPASLPEPAAPDDDPPGPPATSGAARRAEDRPARELDDELDRDELRDRYYGLLQELRVMLPGVQIMVAFLFTVPFASGFDQLDEVGRDLYGISLTCGVLAVIAFATPTVFHRVGRRQSRSARLEWGIRTTRAGLVLFAVSLVTGLILVARVVLQPSLAVVAVGLVVAAILGLWVALPLLTSPRHRPTGGGPRP